MSAEENSRDDLRLPDELAAYEARLAAAALASSPLDRDVLLYRAGWAAAEAGLARRGAAPASTGPRGVERRTAIGWSAVSAAVAAALAVAITWSIASPAAQVPLVADVAHSVRGDAAPARVIATDAPTAPSAGAAGTLPFPRLDALLERGTFPRRGMTPMTLWTASRGAGVGRWDEPILVSQTSQLSTPTIGVEGATARELLHQVLPPGRNTSADEATGPTLPIIEFFRPLTRGGDAI